MAERFAGFRLEEVEKVPVLWIEDPRFKTFRLSFCCQRPMDERVSARALLPGLLLHGTASHPGRPALAARMEELYGALVAPAVARSGESQVLRFTLDAVAGGSLPDRPDQVREGMDFLGEYLTAPRLEDGAFPQAVFVREQRQALAAARAIVDDKGSFAHQEARRRAFEGEPLATPDHGGADAIAALTARDPESARQDFLAHGRRWCVAMGQLPPDLPTRLQPFLGALPDGDERPVPRPVIVEPRPLREHVDRVPLQQSHQILIWRTPRPESARDRAALVIAAGILGGGPHSRLFRIVREQRSQAYSIGAHADPEKGCLWVVAGLAEAHAEAVAEEVARQIADLAAGARGPGGVRHREGRDPGAVRGGLRLDSLAYAVHRRPVAPRRGLHAGAEGGDLPGPAPRGGGGGRGAAVARLPVPVGAGRGGVVVSAFEIVKDPVLGEEVWIATTSAGLPVRIAPTPRFREAAAVLTVRYGSTDLGFVEDGREVWTPAGMAHYLEHKLFEDEELQAFDRFARRGAQVNAMTGFARTQYFFTATDRVEENLADLLRLVVHAHITDENVEKERGIIAEEVRMYEDSPQFCTVFDLLGCLYREHPVRLAVGGTVASIQDITAEGLLQCHRAFYRTGNAALAVAGPVDPERILALAEACGLAAGPAPDSLTPEDLGPADGARHDRPMAVARPKVMLGFKERSLPADDAALQRRSLATRVALDRLFAASSRIREDLHERDVVDDTLSTSYYGERTFGFGLIAAETETPEPVIDELRNVVLRPLDVDDAHLERLRRRALGSFVRGLDQVKGLAFTHAQEALDGTPPFQALDRMAALTVDAVQERAAELFRPENLGVAVTQVGR